MRVVDYYQEVNYPFQQYQFPELSGRYKEKESIIYGLVIILQFLPYSTLKLYIITWMAVEIPLSLTDGAVFASLEFDIPILQGKFYHILPRFETFWGIDMKYYRLRRSRRNYS